MDPKADCDQLNQAHVAKCKKEETRTNKCHCPLSSVGVKVKIRVKADHDNLTAGTSDIVDHSSNDQLLLDKDMITAE